MKDLVALLCGLGFQQVRTYIQSGNVVFRGSGTAAALIEDIALDARQLAQAAAANPFPAARARPQSLHLWFLERAPGAASLKSLQALRADAPEGIGRSKFAARTESLLGVAGTARNWRTLTQLLAMAGG